MGSNNFSPRFHIHSVFIGQNLIARDELLGLPSTVVAFRRVSRSMRRFPPEEFVESSDIGWNDRQNFCLQTSRFQSSDLVWLQEALDFQVGKLVLATLMREWY